MGSDWKTVKSGVATWLEVNQKHPHFDVMQSFRKSGFLRKSFDLKDVRNDLMGIIGSPKPWEVVVGQAIGLMGTEHVREPDSLASYLGGELVAELLGE